MNEKKVITVSAIINAPVNKVWDYWTNPNHITGWNFASDDWHAPSAQNDLKVGGKFNSRMEAKDGSFGFDFEGVYDQVIPEKFIEYTLGDSRKVKIKFTSDGNTTTIEESFEAESENPVEMQQTGWQMILNNFKRYTEK
ncbi:MAG: SRPBCC family protein [Bacteroidetes bacterium]|nr:SRPBCC family protein [Bacteroidota bacterium]MBL0074292.1 SRPBCC family protein [Bacteroidota bacterium]